MAKQQDIENIRNTAAVFVIFGATGDLAKKRIFPALFKLYKNKLLPQKFKIIACARTRYTSEKFREYLVENLKIEDKSDFPNFAKLIEYFSADIAEDINLNRITKLIDDFEKDANTCPQRIFYMAVSPQILELSFQNFGKNNLHLGCTTHANKPRIIIEKPFGSNLKSAQHINSTLRKYFLEDQIYRIDHYLGKETVQNIFAFRFANEIFEPVWNNKYIDHVQITTAEYLGVEKRGEFYDKTGALRDIVQNHLIQLMTLVTMEAPENFNAQQIMKNKLEIIKNIKKLSTSEVENSTVRGQYEGYLQEEKINPSSQTESYALIKLAINNNRWHDVPFYLRTGKKLTGKVTSIIIRFKEKGNQIPNHITIQIQPNEGIGIELAAKKPGLGTELEPVDMEFCYKTSFDTAQPEAYERLLLDVILADQSLFLSQEIIEESWKIIDPIEKVWQNDKPKLAIYKPGTWGPKEADELIEKDGREWLQPLLTICKL